MAFTPEPSTIPGRAFSGANITAVIGNRVVGSLQALTCSITRETAAVYAFGDASPKAFVKGKRGIAGSLVFTQFDRHPLLEDVFREAFDKPLYSNPGLFSSRFLELTNQQSLFGGDLLTTRNFEVHSDLNGGAAQSDLSFGDNSLAAGTPLDLQDELNAVYAAVANQHLRYSDQIPEFDIVVNFVNESGDASFLVIGGVTLVNEGWGWSLDDLTSETALTYVAKVISPLTNTNRSDAQRAQRVRFDSGTGNPIVTQR